VERTLYIKFTRRYSQFMYGLCIGFTALILVILVLVTGYLLSIGAASLSWDFFTKSQIGDGYPGGMKHALVGTMILIALASAVGVPLGMLTGIYLSEYGANSFIASPARFICDVLSGVPSIVVGMLG